MVHIGIQLLPNSQEAFELLITCSSVEIIVSVVVI